MIECTQIKKSTEIVRVKMIECTQIKKSIRILRGWFKPMK